MQACLYVPHAHTRDTVSRNAREAKVITVAVLLLVRVLAVGWLSQGAGCRMVCDTFWSD